MRKANFLKRLSSFCLALLTHASIAPAWVGAAGYPVNARVSTVCNFNGNGNVATLTFSITVPSNGNIPSPPANQTIANVLCNKASTITVTSTSLRATPPAGSVSTNQTQAINLTATTSGAGIAAASVTTQENNRLGTLTAYVGTPVAQSPIKSGTTIVVGISGLSAVTTGGGSNVKPNPGAYIATVTVTMTAT